MEMFGFGGFSGTPCELASINLEPNIAQGAFLKMRLHFIADFARGECSSP